MLFCVCIDKVACGDDADDLPISGDGQSPNMFHRHCECGVVNACSNGGGD